MRSALKTLFKKSFITAASLALVLTVIMPLVAQALTVDVTTAKSNETGTNNVLGGTPTRVTWETVADKGESISKIDLQLPQGSSFTDDSTVQLTVLDGLTRLDANATTTIDKKEAKLEVDFSKPFGDGKRLRVEMYKTCLPNVDGDVSLTGTYTTTSGKTADLPASPAITVSYASPAQVISNMLGEQPWVQAWDSVTFLKLFFDPQLIIESIPTVFIGWLLSLALVLVGFPLAIPLGLIGAFMKISKSRVLHVLASIYTGLIRGTPLFLQIYIAFFGLPLIGISFDYYVLAILVLGFNSGAYLCEIFRAGIQSIPNGQFEASRSLGMNFRQTMFSVIIPQTVRRVIPTMTSEFILLYKDTSLLAAVGVMELMLYSRGIVNVTGNMTPYIVAACFYLIVTLPLIHVVSSFEKKLALADGGQQTEPKQKKVRKNRRGAFAQMRDEVKEAGADTAAAEKEQSGDEAISDNSESKEGESHE